MSQHRVTLQPPTHSRPYWLFALFAPLCVAAALLAYTVGVHPSVLLFFAAALALFAYAAYAEVLNRRRVVVLQLEDNIVTITVSGLINAKTWRCELSQLSGVASYITPERFARSRAELLCTNGRDGVLLVQGIALGHNEHPAVLAARTLVSEALGIKDLGFMGNRPRATQLRANAA